MTALARTLPLAAERFRAAAWADLGLHTGDVARLALEDTQLVPNRAGRLQRAGDVLDVRERARVMRAIAAAYARLHARAPSELAWAGFAAIAVNDGVRPTVELALAATRLRWPAMHAIEDALKCAFETNVAIYADLAWVHHAYVDGGIALVRALHRDGELDADLAASFEDIARGAGARRWFLGDVAREHVLRGNLALFRREQDAIVTPIFERYAAAMALATRLGLVAVPGRTLAAKCAALGGSPRWTAAASYGPFAPRWAWLVDCAWRPFTALGRDELAPALERARRGIPERPAIARTALAIVRLLAAERARVTLAG
jgi:hypothetical protein